MVRFLLDKCKRRLFIFSPSQMDERVSRERLRLKLKFLQYFERLVAGGMEEGQAPGPDDLIAQPEFYDNLLVILAVRGVRLAEQVMSGVSWANLCSSRHCCSLFC